MNLSLNNPYGDVIIPRAKLRTENDSSTIIINPMALDSYNRNNAQNPYGNFKAEGGEAVSDTPVYGEQKNNQNSFQYTSQSTFTVKEDKEQINRCRACCCCCWRRK